MRAAEALSRLVAELKEYLILNDFSTINESITHRAKDLHAAQKQVLNETQKLYESYKQTQLRSLD